jgi:phosphatidylglycerol:prolipoprotein diacylglycerol transferase
MIPVLLEIGPVRIYSYGLMMALGFLAAGYVIWLDCRRRGINPEYASSVIFWAAIGGIIGSRLYHVIDNWQYYASDPALIVWSSAGFVWYGGLIGGLASVYFVSHYYQVPFLATADMCGPALAIGQAIGRLGCQLSGDGDWGLPSTLPWAMAYPKAIVGWNSETVLKLDEHGQLVSGYFPGVRVHPAPIYETLLYLGVFLILWRFRTRLKQPGRLFFLYFILAGAGRFAVEFVRINPRVFYGLSEAQLIAIAMMLVGTVVFIAMGERGSEIRTKAAARA